MLLVLLVLLVLLLPAHGDDVSHIVGLGWAVVSEHARVGTALAELACDALRNGNHTRLILLRDGHVHLGMGSGLG